MTSSLDRIRLLLPALAQFPELGPLSEKYFLELLRTELGHEAALDRFVPTGTTGLCSRALSPSGILHVLSGNLPNPGILSLSFGLILGCPNTVRLPSEGGERVNEFIQALTHELRRFVSILPAKNKVSFDQALTLNPWVIVYGSDETVEAIRRKIPSTTRLLAYGHRLSLGVVLSPGVNAQTAHQAAFDVSAFDQQGCLSPHDFYVQEGGAMSAREWAAALAHELDLIRIQALTHIEGCGSVGEGIRFAHQKRTWDEQAAIHGLRSAYSFRAANDSRVRLWQSEDDTWTVIYEEELEFATSCLNRVIYVKPFRELEDVVAGTRTVRSWLSTVGITPLAEASEDFLLRLGAQRYCEVGRMQRPSLLWHHDGRPNLADLVTWVDREDAPAPRPEDNPKQPNTASQETP